MLNATWTLWVIKCEALGANEHKTDTEKPREEPESETESESDSDVICGMRKQ